MKRYLFILTLFISVSVWAGNNTGKLSIGEQAVFTEFKMTDVSGKSISLADAKKENGLLVLFSCNTCPFVKKWEGRYNDLKSWADQNKVGMIVLNSNYQKRSGDDSLEEMKAKAKTQDYKFHYVVDENSQIANAFGAQVTPHAFLFDNNMKLAYKGAIDDNYDSADQVSKAYVKDAIGSLAEGEVVAVPETNPVGCGIKRKLD